MKTEDLLGQHFGRLIARRIVRRTDKTAFIECSCTCGTTKIIRASNLQSGACRSCGCYRRERIIKMNFKHGAATRKGCSTEWTIWRGMHQRCEDKNCKDYPRYGAKGIRVCARWSGSNGFAHFFEDMGNRPLHKTLDRIKGTKGYTLANCRWATPKEQAANRSPRTRGIGSDHWSHRNPSKALLNLHRNRGSRT